MSNNLGLTKRRNTATKKTTSTKRTKPVIELLEDSDAEDEDNSNSKHFSPRQPSHAAAPCSVKRKVEPTDPSNKTKKNLKRRIVDIPSSDDDDLSNSDDDDVVEVISATRFSPLRRTVETNKSKTDPKDIKSVAESTTTDDDTNAKKAATNRQRKLKDTDSEFEVSFADSEDEVPPVRNRDRRRRSTRTRKRKFEQPTDKRERTYKVATTCEAAAMTNNNDNTNRATLDPPQPPQEFPAANHHLTAEKKLASEARASTSGDAKKKETAPVASPSPPQRCAAATEHLSADLICPLSLELPVDPVMADDGHVYERYWIEQHLNESNGARGMKSPLTRQKITKRLVPALQHKKIIETAIENGTVSEELSTKWKEKKMEKKTMNDLLTKAKGGDVKAMEKVANSYYGGENGFPEDEESAFVWFDKAHWAGSVIGMAEMGDMLVVGNGVPQQDEAKGLVYLGLAAGKGNDMANYALGTYFADGDHGLPVDKPKAIELLQESLRDNCPHPCMNDKAKQQARQMLNEVLNSPNEE